VQFVYLALAAAYMLVVMSRRSQGQSLRWKVLAALAWIGIFAAVAFVAARAGWRLN
jgi:multisubunit Na+/H+ antiporter MnhB subunit